MPYVYLLTNEDIKGLVNVGYTDGTPEDRAVELSITTHVPSDFRVHSSWEVDGRFVEGLVFTELAPYRVNGREFFRLSPEDACRVIGAVVLRWKVSAHRSTLEALRRDPDRAFRREALRILQDFVKDEEFLETFEELKAEAEAKKRAGHEPGPWQCEVWREGAPADLVLTGLNHAGQKRRYVLEGVTVADPGFEVSPDGEVRLSCIGLRVRDPRWER